MTDEERLMAVDEESRLWRSERMFDLIVMGICLVAMGFIAISALLISGKI